MILESISFFNTKKNLSIRKFKKLFRINIKAILVSNLFPFTQMQKVKDKRAKFPKPNWFIPINIQQTYLKNVWE